jgi:hypothetical protein
MLRCLGHAMGNGNCQKPNRRNCRSHTRGLRCSLPSDRCAGILFNPTHHVATAVTCSVPPKLLLTVPLPPKTRRAARRDVCALRPASFPPRPSRAAVHFGSRLQPPSPRRTKQTPDASRWLPVLRRCVLPVTGANSASVSRAHDAAALAMNPNSLGSNRGSEDFGKTRHDTRWIQRALINAGGCQSRGRAASSPPATTRRGRSD